MTTRSSTESRAGINNEKGNKEKKIRLPQQLPDDACLLLKVSEEILSFTRSSVFHLNKANGVVERYVVLLI